MLIYPKLYLKNVLEISEEILIKNNIKALILDIDNTIIDTDKNKLKGINKWCEVLKNKGIKFCILSNTNHKQKAKIIAEDLDIPYIHLAMKPLKKGFIKAKEILNENSKNIAVIGDQIFTDVIGANRCNMFSILVEPIDEKDIFITKIKRPLENWIIRKYKKSKTKEEEET